MFLELPQVHADKLVPNSHRHPHACLLQKLGWRESDANIQLEYDIGFLAAVDAAAGGSVLPGVSAARRAVSALDGVRDLLSKEALLAAVLLREQEVSVCGYMLRLSMKP